jgi:DNA-binding CsgD family transcriptional regulator
MPSADMLVKATKGKPAGVGLILLNSSLRIVYYNSEAQAILACPNTAGKTKLSDGMLSKLIPLMTRSQQSADGLPRATFFMSGRRRYVCRSFVFEGGAEHPAKPVIAITIERDRSALLDMATRYQLTYREMEAVRHLADGLTREEIARRMEISAKAVATSLDVAMNKLGVNSSSDVVGALMNGAHFPGLIQALGQEHTHSRR